MSSLTRNGVELIADGRVGNELAVYDEYSAHPTARTKDPGTCCPRGRWSAPRNALPTRCRPTAARWGSGWWSRGRVGDVLSYTQTITLWRGVDRVDCRTVIDGFTGADQLLRLRWPCPVPGAMPVSEVGDAVIGRGFGLLHERDSDDAVDTAEHPYTLDNPAYGWFGLSSAVRVRVRDGRRGGRAGSVGGRGGGRRPDDRGRPGT